MSSENEADLQEDERYLVFSLNGIFYASPLLAVREVIEFTTPKPVPNLQKECLGVINLRGKIVPVFEMSKVSGKERGDFSVGPYFMMVVESGKGSAACVVDKIEAVTDFPESQVDRKHSHRGLKSAFLGIAKYKSELVNVIDLQKILGDFFEAADGGYDNLLKDKAA